MLSPSNVSKRLLTIVGAVSPTSNSDRTFSAVCRLSAMRTSVRVISFLRLVHEDGIVLPVITVEQRLVVNAHDERIFSSMYGSISSTFNVGASQIAFPLLFRVLQ